MKNRPNNARRHEAHFGRYSFERKALERKRKKEQGLAIYWITPEEYQLITELRRLQSLERDVQERETQH